MLLQLRNITYGDIIEVNMLQNTTNSAESFAEKIQGNTEDTLEYVNTGISAKLVML